MDSQERAFIIAAALCYAEGKKREQEALQNGGGS